MLFYSARCTEKDSYGLFNEIPQLNLPELHYPGRYQFLGPFTKTEARIARGQRGINPLDEGAREHDLYCTRHEDTKSCHIVDKVLQDIGVKRAFTKDASVGESCWNNNFRCHVSETESRNGVQKKKVKGEI